MIERPSLVPKGDDKNIESPREKADRPADGPFTPEHFAILSKEWDAMRTLPDDCSWNMDYFQWNGVSAALKIAANKNEE